MSAGPEYSPPYVADWILDKEESQSVLVVGCGQAGLAAARTLIRDGFKVTVVAKEAAPGGLWSRSWPYLVTNGPWHYIFPGLDMPKPQNFDGMSIPAETFKRYLEDFCRYFVEDQADVRFCTSVQSMVPQGHGRSGWKVQFRSWVKGPEEVEEWGADFDRVVLACNYLGKKMIPPELRHSDLPVFHSEDLLDPDKLDELLRLAPRRESLGIEANGGSTAAKRNSDAALVKYPNNIAKDGSGDASTIVVIGSGKSALDMATMVARKGRKVVLAWRDDLKWQLLAPPLGATGAGMVQILMNAPPPVKYDNWLIWFFHCTRWGAALHAKGFARLRAGIKAVYGDLLPHPKADPFVSINNLGGSLTMGPGSFHDMLRQGRIQILPQARVSSVEKGRVRFTVSPTTSSVEAPSSSHSDMVTIRCSAVVAATGYQGGQHDFVDEGLRREMGMANAPPREGWQQRVQELRKEYTTLPSDLPEDQETQLPLYYRGILPCGRLQERDLAIIGGQWTAVGVLEGLELESHWISSLFKGDKTFLNNLPETVGAAEEACHDVNDRIRARFPYLQKSDWLLKFTRVQPFSASWMEREMCRDMGVDPWRQKPKPGLFAWLMWWSGGWITVPRRADDYLTIGAERAALRRKSAPQKRKSE